MKSIGDPHLTEHNSSHKLEAKNLNSQMPLNIQNLSDGAVSVIYM